MTGKVLVIACGALAREIDALKTANGWDHVELACLDAKLHHRPERIPERLREKIRRSRPRFERIFVAYADCGTTGGVDRVIEEEGPGIERLPGVHCYQFFAGAGRFAELSEREPGTFYLTDFLARHFERFVVEPLKLDVHPELEAMFFGNYRRLVYLSQVLDEELIEKARGAAARLGLAFEHIHTGYGELGTSLAAVADSGGHDQEDRHLLA